MRRARITVSVFEDTVKVEGFDGVGALSELPPIYKASNPFFYEYTLKSDTDSVVCLVLMCSAGRYIIRAGDVFLDTVFDALVAQMRIAGDRLSEIRKSGKTNRFIVEI